MTVYTPARIDATPRRNLRREGAAMYVGISPSKFDQLVREGKLPAPFRVDSCVLWDIRDLDPAIDELKNGPGHDDTWGDFDGAGPLAVR